MKKAILSAFVMMGLASLVGAFPIVSYVQLNPPVAPQTGGFNTQSGTVGTMIITGLPLGQCVQVGNGGLLQTVPCGSGGVGPNGQIVASNQYSVPYYYISGSSNALAGLTPGTSGQVLTTGGASSAPFWATPSTTTASTYIRNGYSGRFSESVNVTLASQALDQIFQFQYVAPAITFTTTPGATVREFGTTLTNVSLNAFTVKKSSPITVVQWKLNGGVIKSSYTPTATGGTEVYIDTATRSATAAYLATVSDNVSTTTSNTVTFTFVYPFYYGVGAQALSFASVQGLTKLVQTQQNTTTVTSPSSQVYYFAYPQAYGSLTSILDQNGFETISGYTQRSGTMTMLDSTTQNYYVYEFNSPTTQTSFSNTYKF